MGRGPRGCGAWAGTGAWPGAARPGRGAWPGLGTRSRRGAGRAARPPADPAQALSALARAARDDAPAGGARRRRGRAGLNLVRARETAGFRDEVSAAVPACGGLPARARVGTWRGSGGWGPQSHSARVGATRAHGRLAALRRPRGGGQRGPGRADARG